MNKEIQAEWIAELRSGKYKKGVGRLKTVREEFCCLGVLCDMYAKKHGKKWTPAPSYSRNDKGQFIELFGGECNYPPKQVMKWAGLAVSEENAGYDIAYKLARINDDVDTFGPVIEMIEIL